MAMKFGGDNDFGLLAGEEGVYPLSFGGDDDFDFQPQTNTSSTCGLVDYTNFNVVGGIVNDTWFLTASGRVSTISLQVVLRPRNYIERPEFWGIEVVGCLPPIVLPTEGVFFETISVTDYMGTKGIEVIGATKSDRWSRE